MNNLTNIGTINGILERHGFYFSKALGQNFLINPSVCPKIAEMGGAKSDVGVIEVGPGIGVLTVELAKRANKVVAIELDARLLPVLKETLSDCDNVTIINDDILKVDLAKLINEEFEGLDVVVCANLPYYITSPVIMHLLESRFKIKSLTVMVQKEAGKRLCAKDGTREAGAVTLAVRYYAEPKILFDVSSGSFMPRPKVDSCVIKLDIRGNSPVDVNDELQMFKIIRASFNQRRKTLLNALVSGLGLTRQAVESALTSAGIPLNERGEKLTLRQFALLSNCLY